MTTGLRHHPRAKPASPELAPSLLKRLREKLAKAEKNDPNIYPLY